METEEKQDNGLTLLDRSRKGITIFSHVGVVLLLLAVQIVFIIVIARWFENFFPHYLTISVLLSAVLVVYLINGPIDPTGKITWLVLIMLLPVFGSLLYVYIQSDIGHRTLAAKFDRMTRQTKWEILQQPVVEERLESERPGAAALVRYLQRSGCFPAYQGTEVTYFPSGEAKFQALLQELEQAKRFIFLEYFIIREGLMWGKILEVLSRKAAQGVDVRVLYDGTCEFSNLPHDYPKRLAALGIQCRVFSAIQPFVSTHYNYRDHRKILVIDGQVAFNGGINLADEYINHVPRFGYWKDTAVMLRGDAVRSFTLMFLQVWCLDEKAPDFTPHLACTAPQAAQTGFVIPYGDCPLDSDKVGERVYMDLLNRAQRYVHIMTPYLILDGELETALKFAAERGVEVTLILPGVPDKKIPYALAKTYYASLMASGVKILEFTPGFIHAKSFVVDDTEAVVGTINLDYRSLYHHFECATYLVGTDCIQAIEADFQETAALCRPVTRQSLRQEKLTTKLIGVLTKVIAPLL